MGLILRSNRQFVTELELTEVIWTEVSVGCHPKSLPETNILVKKTPNKEQKHGTSGILKHYIFGVPRSALYLH